MAENSCLVHLRVWGDFACITRPELKAERVSYPILTPSAARGILEAIYYEPQMYYLVQEIGVIKRGHWISVRRNEVQRGVSLSQIKKGMTDPSTFRSIEGGAGGSDMVQRGMLALADVEYLITAEIRLSTRAELPRDNLAKYRDQFICRAARGKCSHRPYLGCREFAADFTHVKDPSQVELCASDWPYENIGLMLYDVFDPLLRESGRPVRPEAVFFKAEIRNAKLDCRPNPERLIRRKGVM